ncbi:MAG: HAD family hydrolase [Eubacterium sp.]
MFNTVLFDLDGTLTDSSQGIINSIFYALHKMGIDETDADKLKKFLGPPLIDSFKEFYGFSQETAEQAVAYYREYFSTKGLLENSVYSGIPELLGTLNTLGKRLIITTSKPEPYTIRILEHFDLIKYFDFVAGSNMDNTRCKKAEVISYALASCKITDMDNTVMIGDREHDIIGAKAVGISSIGVLYGYGSYEELNTAGADYTAKDTEDILNIING